MAAEQQVALWELAGEDPQISISPFVWRVRLLLAYKGLSYEPVPWRLMDKDAIKPFHKVPVMVFNGKKIGDSLDISKFLEKEFPEPSVFNTTFQAVIVMDEFELLTKGDQEYFRESNEKTWGSTLETISADKPAKLQAFRSALEPMRQTLNKFHFLGGNEISYADIALAGNFMWLRSISKTQLLEKNDPVYEWRERIFKEFEGTISKSSHLSALNTCLIDKMMAECTAVQSSVQQQ